MTKPNQTSILSDALLARCHERAPIYDRENRFFFEDFEELRDAGYLLMAVPAELGGGGKNLAEVCLEERRLSYFAPATALALNMHLYWTGVAADLWRGGDKSMEWLLKAAVQGEVFAAGHAESGGEFPLIFSTTKAERVEGGYRFTGHKSFGSLSPVWTYLGLHGTLAPSTGGDGQIIHAFAPRTAPGLTVKESWDTLGMRATRSDDTILAGVFVPDQYIVRTLPIGFAGADMFVLTVFAWAEATFGNIYYGLGRRALDLTLENAKRKTSISMTRPMNYHPNVQYSVADMVMELAAVEALLERTAQEWSSGVMHPDWLAKLVTTKYKAVEGVWRVVDTAFELSGGFGIFKKNELERLFRDARLGRIHPANASVARELVGKLTLDVNPAEGLRWG